MSVGGHGIFISGWFLICTWEVHFGIDDLSCQEEKKNGLLNCNSLIEVAEEESPFCFR